MKNNVYKKCQHCGRRKDIFHNTCTTTVVTGGMSRPRIETVRTGSCKDIADAYRRGTQDISAEVLQVIERTENAANNEMTARGELVTMRSAFFALKDLLATENKGNNDR
jgi:hypothetical protein